MRALVLPHPRPKCEGVNGPPGGLWLGEGGFFAGGPGPVGFDLYWTAFAGEPVVVAAPEPVFGFFHEAAFYWVAVDVAELLSELALGEDVEVVVVELPEARAVAFELFRCLGFEGTEDAAEGGLGWLAEEQVDVLGHEDVAEDVKLVLLSYAFEGVEEDGAGVVVVEVGETVVTTEGDEVVVAESVVSLKVARHGWDEYIGVGFSLIWIRWWYGHPPPAHAAKCAS